jgi:hypothetical protein
VAEGQQKNETETVKKENIIHLGREELGHAGLLLSWRKGAHTPLGPDCAAQLITFPKIISKFYNLIVIISLISPGHLHSLSNHRTYCSDRVRLSALE